MPVKLAPAKPDDRYVRMHFAFDGAVARVVPEDEASDACGWIELWADDAKACKESLRRIGGRLYVLNERRDKRTADMTDEKAVEELNEYNGLLTAGLAHCTKAWSLVDSEGKPVDATLTFENAKAVYGDDDHNLRDILQAFLKGRENFPLRASASS